MKIPNDILDKQKELKEALQNATNQFLSEPNEETRSQLLKILLDSYLLRRKEMAEMPEIGRGIHFFKSYKAFSDTEMVSLFNCM
jgi:hypothetical protein